MSVHPVFQKMNDKLKGLQDTLDDAHDDLRIIYHILEGQHKLLVRDKDNIDYFAAKGRLFGGSVPTIQVAISMYKYFEIKARKVHGDKYDYSKVKYKNARSKVEVICPEHGSFFQTPDNHLHGYGCLKCAQSGGGWSYSLWKEAGEKSRNFDSFKVYILEIWNDNEKFYKIGKTFTTVGVRFARVRDMPYQWKVLKTIEGDARYISELEVALHKENKANSYTPNIHFEGSTECFSINPLQ